MKLIIFHMYSQVMNLYGDRGNLIALKKRASWRGIGVEVRDVGLGEPADFSDCDILFVGGGQDREQEIIYRDLLGHGPAIKKYVDCGGVLLAVCGGYQLLGKYYQFVDNTRLKGVGLFDLRTIASGRRAIGNIAIRADIGNQNIDLVGFENHGGKTLLGDGAKPLGKVIYGQGNNGKDQTEGIIYKNAIGTYLHGSLLPKNPQLADYLITNALKRKYHDFKALSPLADKIEMTARQIAFQIAKKES